MNNHTTVYIGMDMHKESFTLCCFALGETEPGYVQTIPSDHILVVKYVNRMRKLYGEGTEFYNGPRVKTSNEDLMVNVWL